MNYFFDLTSFQSLLCIAVAIASFAAPPVVATNGDDYFIPVGGACWQFKDLQDPDSASLFEHSNDPTCVFSQPGGPTNPNPNQRTKISKLKKIHGNKYQFKKMTSRDDDGNKIKEGWKGSLTFVEDPQLTVP